MSSHSEDPNRIGLGRRRGKRLTAVDPIFAPTAMRAVESTKAKEDLKARSGKKLTINMPPAMPMEPGFMEQEIDYIRLGDAANECKHGRLPHDKTLECGCWGPKPAR